MFRRHASAIGLVCALSAVAPAMAQSAPTPLASISDIQITETDGRVSILVKLSAQPHGAAAHAGNGSALIDIEGLAVAPFTLTPASGHIVRAVEAVPADAGGSIVRLHGAALEGFSTTIYRNAVLIEATLSPAPAMPPLETKAPAITAAPPTPSIPYSTTGLAGLDAAACTAAGSAYNADTWNIQALGDHALCLIDSGDAAKAQPLLAQLEAFAPEDWRVVLAHAAIARAAGEESLAEIGYRAVAIVAPDARVRGAITAMLDAGRAH